MLEYIIMVEKKAKTVKTKVKPKSHDWEALIKEFVINQEFSSMREWLIKVKDFKDTQLKSKPSLAAINDGNKRRREVQEKRFAELEKIIEDNSRTIAIQLKQARNTVLNKIAVWVSKSDLTLKEGKDFLDMVRKELGEPTNIISFQENSSKIAQQFDTLIGNTDVFDS